MFKYDINLKFKPGVLLGFYNIENVFLVSIKNSVEELYPNSLNYIEITNDILNSQKIRRRKEKNFDELGMISSNWIEKVQEYLPAVIVQMIDITDVVNMTSVELNKICEPIIKEILTIKNTYQSSNQFIIIKNLNKVYGLEETIKNQITSKYKFLREKSFFFINDNNHLINPDINKRIANIIKEEISNFYNSKVKNYINRFRDQNYNEQKEYAIKYLIKIYLISYISNTINLDNNNIIFYDYLKKAYIILSQKLNKKTYMFSQPNIKVIYLELKNIADFLIYQRLSQKNLSLNNIINLINKHLINFDCINFYNDKNTDINIIIKAFKKMKDIYFINLLWKHSWYIYLLDNYQNINLYDIDNISLKGYIMNNLFHLYYFLKKESNFIEEISKQFKEESSYKKIRNKYIEKIPKFYEKEGENIVGKLTDEENLGIYIAELIFENKNLIDSQSVLKILENLIINSRINYYDYYLINKYCFNNIEISGDNDIYIILGKLLHKDNKYLTKFPNIYSDISSKFRTYILNNKLENKDENNYDIFKMTEYLILYASNSKNDLTTEETNKINELLAYNINSNDIINLNSFENKIFNIEVNYNIKEVKPLDLITTNINISLIRKDIIIDIEKIIVYFPKKRQKENEKYFKEIIINKELTKDNPISISFNNLVKFFFNNLYVLKIQLFLKNKVIINLINKEKRNIVFYDKNNNLINENDIMDVNMDTNVSKKISDEKQNDEASNKKSKNILVGKNENHLFNINYRIKIDNNDVFIKHAKATIKLMGGYSKTGEEIKCFQFKTITEKGYNNYGNKQLILDYYNVNSEINPPSLEFVLLIGEIGNFRIDYEIFFTLVNKNCPDDYTILKYDKSVIIQCIEPLKYIYEINSSLYYINQQSKLKEYPVNYPINFISFFENELCENIIIKNIKYIPSSESIQLISSIEKLFSKKQNYKINFSSNDKISLNSKVIFKEIMNGSIGKLQICWISENLYNHKFFDESMVNESIFDLGNININKLSIIIQGKYIDKINKYQLKIKNMETKSKIIKFSMKEMNSKPKEEKFILCGKTDINEILLPLKEFNIQYNIYDKITGSNFFEINDNISYKFNNLITLNEYYIMDLKDKYDAKSLRNIIYYVPEIFKMSN